MTAADLGRLNALLQGGMLRHLALAVIKGDREESKAWAENAVSKRGFELLELAPERWPTPAINWDVDPANWHRSMDGMSAADFKTHFPDVELYTVDLAELDGALAPRAQRLEGPFSECYRSKTSLLVAHLESGGRVTPPFLNETTAGLGLVGGYHRLGWARHLALVDVPVLVRTGQLTKLVARLPSLKVRTP